VEGLVTGRTGVLLLVCSLAAGCGGGGSGDPAPTPTPEPTNPEIVLLLVSGHSPTGGPSVSYLDDALGPRVVADLTTAGYWTEARYYVDAPTATDAGGYGELVADMRWIRDNWVGGQSRPTRVVVIAHSHGGAWATAAIRAVPDLPIRLQVALDHSSYAWDFAGHGGHDDVMGGDPRNEYTILAVGDCPDDDDLWSDTTYVYDLEDVVFPNVAEAFEVRAGQAVLPFDPEPFDEQWNARLDTTFTGLYCYYSATDHGEVRRTDGTTYPVVIGWILERLGGT
jgi:hypothetical protein